MPAYRCYFFHSDAIVGVDSSVQPDDGAATWWGLEVLARERAASAVEVWEQARRICRHRREA
jgi:hypothetical protein